MPEAARSSADVDAGRILLKTPFSNLLLCKRVPGAAWDGARRVWTYPATPQHARLIRSTIPGLSASDSFAALLAGPAKPPVVAVPGPKPEPQATTPLPAGLKTTPWRHQVAAYEFSMERFLQGPSGVMLACGMGTGKSAMACMLLLALRAQRVLIACPLRVVQVWLSQFERHVATPMVVVALDEDAGSVADKQRLAEEKLRLAQVTGVPFIAVINYDSAWRAPFAEWAEKQTWDLVVADECVPADTMIDTPRGPWPVQDLKVGDFIWGFDHNVGRVVPTAVSAIFYRLTPEPLIAIGGLHVTPHHPIWTEQEGYVPAREVSGSSLLRVLCDETTTVRKVRASVRTGEAPAVLQQIELGDPHLLPVHNLGTATGNYFANGILVHNCHRLKTPGGKASLFFKRLAKHALHRLGLSGTPMPHGHTDLYAIFRFLDISIFGPSFNAFKQNYCVMGGYQRKQIVAPKNMEDFHARMNRITFRVGKDVLDLPPETHVTYTCELSGEAARVYKDLEEDFVARVLDGQVTAANAMVKLLRLQQVTGGWVKTDDGHHHRIDSAKQKLLEDTLEDIGSGEPVVVFCRFHADLDAVHEAAKSLGYSSLELSGRRDELQDWQDGQGQVLAVQISAGGVGVDLTRARYSAYFSLSFSLGEYDQALSRVHRPGQSRPVEHIHLVARNTVDQKILRALEKRAEVIAAILAEIKNQ